MYNPEEVVVYGGEILKKRIIVLLGLVVCLIVTGFFFIKNYNEIPASTNSFPKTVENIVANFSYDDYEELMQGKQSHVLALPLESEIIDPNENFIANQQLFVYKNKNSKAILLMQITPTKCDNEWNSCLDYSSDLFNAVNSIYGGEYNPNIPNVQFAFHSFSFEGCHYSILCLSPDIEIVEGGGYAATELTGFTNELIQFLNLSYEKGA